MRALLYLLAALGCLIGVVTFGIAKSAIHEILGTLMIGFSFMMIGLAAILGELVKLNRKGNN
jgi:predicted membrane protein